MRHPRYLNRPEAGRVLAEGMQRLAGRSGVIVLALPRGGVPVAVPVARHLSASLGVVMVRKLGLPGRSELAMGALAFIDGRIEVIRNESVIGGASVSPDTFEKVVSRESAELERRIQRFRTREMGIAGRAVVVVDDGLATGSTMLAAVTAVRSQQPAEIVVAVPVGARQAVTLLSAVADEVICPATPDPFVAVGVAYEDFTQVSDREVIRLLREGTD